MDVLPPRCCGLDVHKSSISACILVQGVGRVEKHQRRFSAMTQDLRELAIWLRQFEVTHVAMESSGVYWKPVWNILEGKVAVILVKHSTSRMCQVARPTRKMPNGLRSCCNMVSCGPATCPVKSSAICETSRECARVCRKKLRVSAAEFKRCLRMPT